MVGEGNIALKVSAIPSLAWKAMFDLAHFIVQITSARKEYSFGIVILMPLASVDVVFCVDLSLSVEVLELQDCVGKTSLSVLVIKLS